MSQSEKMLWSKLRREQLGVLFHRQVPIGPYTMDFYCASCNLCIEVDGDQHDLIKDARRDAFLLDRGISTLRIPSIGLFGNPENFESWIGVICQRIVECGGFSPP